MNPHTYTHTHTHTPHTHSLIAQTNKLLPWGLDQLLIL